MLCSLWLHRYLLPPPLPIAWLLLLLTRGGDNTWGQNFIRSPPKPDTYHRYKPFCLKDHILLVKKKSLPGNITFWTDMAISTLAEISHISIFACLEPKLIVFQSGTQQQSCRAHKIGVICHQDRPSICICSKARDRTMTALQLAPEWWRAANGGFLRVWLFLILPNPQRTRLKHFDVHWKSFSWIPHLPIFYSCGLVVDSAVDGKDNKKEKTGEVADSWNFLQLGSDMLW